MADDTIHLITYDSEQYPPLLREIAEPPSQLYVRGEPAILHHIPILAVVGSRKASAYGHRSAEKLLPPLFPDAILVSGLAFGIDARVARVSVAAAHPTIAVLGSGIDDASIYPRSHMSLAHHVLHHGGVLISEYPPGTPGYQSHFPARNRIIAGLASATLIVQAAARSGSLITARLALESNRDVCAVPGNITDPLAAGTNSLIRQGATPILKSDDLRELLHLPLSAAAMAAAVTLTPVQHTIVQLLSDTPLHIDELSTRGQLTSADAAAQLSELELQGLVRHVGSMKYVREVDAATAITNKNPTT